MIQEERAQELASGSYIEIAISVSQKRDGATEK
jgi:hypothetical protein